MEYKESNKTSCVNVNVFVKCDKDSKWDKNKSECYCVNTNPEDKDDKKSCVDINVYVECEKKD